MEEWLWELTLRQAEHIDNLELQILELKIMLDQCSFVEIQSCNASEEVMEVNMKELITLKKLLAKRAAVDKQILAAEKKLFAEAEVLEKAKPAKKPAAKKPKAKKPAQS
jgi:hypothetical protein